MVWVYGTFGNGVFFGGYYEIVVRSGEVIIFMRYLEMVIFWGVVRGFRFHFIFDVR